MLATLHHLWPVSLLGVSPSTQTCPNISLFWCPTESLRTIYQCVSPVTFSPVHVTVASEVVSLLHPPHCWEPSSGCSRMSKTNPVPSLDCPQPQLPVTFPRIFTWTWSLPQSDTNCVPAPLAADGGGPGLPSWALEGLFGPSPLPLPHRHTQAVFVSCTLFNHSGAPRLSQTSSFLMFAVLFSSILSTPRIVLSTGQGLVELGSLWNCLDPTQEELALLPLCSQLCTLHLVVLPGDCKFLYDKRTLLISSSSLLSHSVRT